MAPALITLLRSPFTPPPDLLHTRFLALLIPRLSRLHFLHTRRAAKFFLAPPPHSPSWSHLHFVTDGYDTSPTRPTIHLSAPVTVTVHPFHSCTWTGPTLSAQSAPATIALPLDLWLRFGHVASVTRLHAMPFPSATLCAVHLLFCFLPVALFSRDLLPHFADSSQALI